MRCSFISSNSKIYMTYFFIYVLWPKTFYWYFTDLKFLFSKINISGQTPQTCLYNTWTLPYDIMISFVLSMNRIRKHTPRIGVIWSGPGKNSQDSKEYTQGQDRYIQGTYRMKKNLHRGPGKVHKGSWML